MPKSEDKAAGRSLLQLYPGRYDVVLILVASAVFLLLGLSMPVLTVQQMWMKNTFSVYTGILNLWQEKQYFLAFVVFFFSLIFPIVKLGGLFAIWFFRMPDSERKRIFRWLSALGKWSMLDVFVVAVIIVTVKLGVLATATPERGIYFFGFSIILAMSATALEERLTKKLH